MKRVALYILLGLSAIVGLPSFLLMSVAIKEMIWPMQPQPGVFVIDKDGRMLGSPGRVSFMSVGDWQHNALVYIVAPAIAVILSVLLFRYCYRNLSGRPLR